MVEKCGEWKLLHKIFRFDPHVIINFEITFDSSILKPIPTLISTSIFFFRKIPLTQVFLTHFSPVSHLGFLTFSGGIEM